MVEVIDIVEGYRQRVGRMTRPELEAFALAAYEALTVGHRFAFNSAEFWERVSPDKHRAADHVAGMSRDALNLIDTSRGRQARNI